MLDIRLRQSLALDNIVSNQATDLTIQTKSQEERVKLLLVRDLFRLGWEMNFKSDRVLITSPATYDKQIIRNSMQMKRQESLLNNSKWINDHMRLAQQNLVDGELVWNSAIEPVIEVCESQEQLDTFRIFRYYWSSPYSEYVGRRIKLLIRDNALPNRPLIGIAALGSSIVHIPDRDDWIGWDKETRTKNLIYAMDAYVLGAVPPYNYLLGGKLISYIIASDEVRKIFESKYKDKVTNISKRTANRLACIFTTSLFGSSSQYNRIKYNNKLLYIPVGETKGYGTLHLTDETFNAMRDFLSSRNIEVANRFGDGPIWRMRVIRSAADLLGFDANYLLRHSFQRKIYAIPLAHNCKQFLTGEHTHLRYFHYSLNDLVSYWKARWLNGRKANNEIRKSVYSFRATNFAII